MPTLEDIEESDPHFARDLERSQEAVRLVARWIARCGLPVTIKPVRCRPNVTHMRDYADDGDLEVEVQGVRRRVEVKWRNLAFTDKKSYPYKTIIVDVCHIYDNAQVKPYAYVILNRDLSAFCVIYVESTIRFWFKRKMTDQAKGRERIFYLCPKEGVPLAWFDASDPRFRAAREEAAPEVCAQEAL